MSGTLLSLAQVSRVYPGGLTALENISLTIEQGDFLVLLGPSGCGKSTLLRLIAGLDAPQSGRLEWASTPPGPGEIGMVFQDANLMPWASALENAALPLRLRGQDPAPARAMLERMGLAAFEAARPATLSGGMRMRVAIARALAPRPRLLLLDEPFAALDEFTRHRLQEELAGLARETKASCVLVTHSIYEAAYLATKIAVLSPRPGRIAAQFAYAAPATDRMGAEFAARVAELTECLHGVHTA